MPAIAAITRESLLPLEAYARARPEFREQQRGVHAREARTDDDDTEGALVGPCPRSRRDRRERTRRGDEAPPVDLVSHAQNR